MDGTMLLLRGLLERERRRAVDDYRCLFEAGKFALVLDVDPGVRAALRRQSGTASAPLRALQPPPSPSGAPFAFTHDATATYAVEYAARLAASAAVEKAADEREVAGLSDLVSKAAASVAAVVHVTARPVFSRPLWGSEAYKVHVQGSFAAEQPEDRMMFYDDLIRELKRRLTAYV
jgi:hypothetical protein